MPDSTEILMVKVHADLSALEAKSDDPAARRDARMLCNFFGLPVPEWARSRQLNVRGIRATSRADYFRQYYLKVTKSKREEARRK